MKSIKEERREKVILSKLHKFSVQTVQGVWNEKNLNIKKSLTIDIINNFKFDSKKKLFLNQINKAKNANEIDRIVSNIYLFQQGMGVK